MINQQERKTQEDLSDRRCRNARNKEEMKQHEKNQRRKENGKGGTMWGKKKYTSGQTKEHHVIQPPKSPGPIVSDWLVIASCQTYWQEMVVTLQQHIFRMHSQACSILTMAYLYILVQLAKQTQGHRALTLLSLSIILSLLTFNLTFFSTVLSDLFPRPQLSCFDPYISSFLLSSCLYLLLLLPLFSLCPCLLSYFLPLISLLTL